MSNKNIPAICLFSILITYTPTFAGPHDVEVAPPGSRLVSPRVLTSLPFTIKNNGSAKDTFGLAIDLPKGWSSISFLNPVTLKPGQSKKKLITVSVPPTALSNISYYVKLTVTSKADDSVMAAATAELQVKGVSGLRFTAEPYPKIAWAGETVTYGFEIKNLGNSDDTFEIKAHSKLNWKIKTSQKKLALAPYQKEVVRVSLKVPRDISQEQLHVLSFLVVSLNAREQDKDISDKTKLRLKVIPVVDTKGKTYLELPGIMEIGFSKISNQTSDRSEATLRFETAGDLTEEYYSRLYFDGTFFNEQDDFVDYRFDFSKKEDWDLRLGYTSAYFTRLTGDLIGEGISVNTYGKQFETTFFAGRDDVETYDSEANKKCTEYSFGANVSALIGEKGRVGFTALFMDKESSAENTGLYSVSGEYQIFGHGTLYGEMAYGVENTDTAWVTGSDFSWEKLGFGAEYYRAGTDYPGNITDEEGINVYSNYRLFEPLTLWFDYRRYNNNVDDNAVYLTTKTQKIRGGSQFSYGRWPTVDVTVERESKKSNKLMFFTGQDKVEESISLGGYKSFKYITLSTRNKWGTDKNTLRNTTASITEYNATASGYLKMFNWGVSYDRNGYLQEQTAIQSTTEKITYELGCRLFNFFSANIEYTDEVIKINGHKIRKHEYDIDLELTKRVGISENQTLGLKVELDNVTEEDDREWKIGMVWRWNFGTPIPWIKINGRIRGQLFLAENGTGTRDADEKVYPRTRITLNRMHVYTDEKGMFEFPVLEPGAYRLNMDMSQLPSGIIPAIELPQDIHLKKGDNIFVDIFLEQVGTIRGTVFDDGNKNMLKEKEEDGLSPIRLVLVKNGNEIQEAFTGQKGRYILTDIKPGDYVVKIDKEYLPHRYILTTPETIKISVKAKEQIADINFGAYKKPRKIIKTFFKKKKDN